MIDLAELEPPIVIANRLHSRAAVYTEEGRHNAWGQLMLDAEATILSLIQKVEEAEAALKQQDEDQSEMLLIAHLDGHAKGRLAGIEEALGKAARLVDTWALKRIPNEEWMDARRVGREEARIEFAQAIRALKGRAGDTAIERAGGI